MARFDSNIDNRVLPKIEDELVGLVAMYKVAKVLLRCHEKPKKKKNELSRRDTVLSGPRAIERPSRTSWVRSFLISIIFRYGMTSWMPSPWKST